MLQLSPAALRVVGALVEKELTTPQQYPLTLNALRAACNQATARDPVTAYTDDELLAALDELKRAQLVTTAYARGSRVPRFEQQLDAHLDLDRRQTAVLAVLLLRGPQTVGELRQRTDRMADLDSLEEVQEILDGLVAHPYGDPLVTRLPRRPGQSQDRWAHLLGGDVAVAAPVDTPSAPSAPGPVGDDLADEVATLVVEVERLREEVAGLRRRLDDAGL